MYYRIPFLQHSRIGKIKGTEDGQMVARGWGRGDEVMTKGHNVIRGRGDGTVLDLEDSDGHTTVGV